MDMQFVIATIEGVSPLLMNNPLNAMQTGIKVGLKEIPMPETEAETKCYRDSDNYLYLPVGNVRASMFGASTSERIGRGAANKVLAAGLFTHFDRDKAKLYHPTTGEFISEYVIDTRRAVIQGNGVLRSRARINEWAAQVPLWVNIDVLPNPLEVLRHFLEKAGDQVGVLDYRPQKIKGVPGPFGRFRVTDLEYETE